MVSTVSNSGKTNTKETMDKRVEVTMARTIWRPSCDADCKIKELIKIWVREEIADSLITNCKAIADDARKCVIVWASIVINESGWGYKCRKANQYNCFWIMQNENYKSYHDATLHFAWKFQKWWRNAEDMSFFYSPRWSLPRSRYCTSEDSSGSTIWCPNWLRNSSLVFNKLNKSF